jgi:hypothetical protein
VASLPEDSDLVQVVLTLASPHKRTPLMLDSYTYEFYKQLEINRTPNTTFVSVTGGYADFLVPSFLTGVPHKDALNVVVGF